MEKAGLTPSNHNGNSRECENGSLNDSSDSLVIPTDTGSDTSSEITAVLQTENAGGAVGQMSEAGEKTENKTTGSVAGPPKRQRPASAKVRPKSTTSSAIVTTKPGLIRERSASICPSDILTVIVTTMTNQV
jgi:hypothetical protein